MWGTCVFGHVCIIPFFDLSYCNFVVFPIFSRIEFYCNFVFIWNLIILAASGKIRRWITKKHILKTWIDKLKKRWFFMFFVFCFFLYDWWPAIPPTYPVIDIQEKYWEILLIYVHLVIIFIRFLIRHCSTINYTMLHTIDVTNTR